MGDTDTSTTETQTRRDTPGVRLRRRDPSASPYHGETIETYKADARSEVRAVRSDAGEHVIKQFVYQPIRQRAALWVGAHPGQVEMRRNRALRRADVPAVPIVDAGYESVGVGCRLWLITPRVGTSLHHLLKRGDTAQREAYIDAAVALTYELLAAGFTFRDLKPSNIVIDGAGEAYLLDVGGVRKSTAPRRVEQMLTLMDRVMARHGVDPALRRRFALGIANAVDKKMRA